MKVNCYLKVLLILGAVLTFMVTSCDNVTESKEETFTLSGTITKSGVNDGVVAYMKLVSKDGTMTDNALYSSTATFGSGSATYSVIKIKEGEYKLYVFIDINSNAAGDETSVPDAGDYVTSTYINIDSDKTLDAPESVWIVYQP
jgi:hypothetical protein